MIEPILVKFLEIQGISSGHLTVFYGLECQMQYLGIVQPLQCLCCFPCFAGYCHIYLVWLLLLNDFLYRHFDRWILIH